MLQNHILKDFSNVNNTYKTCSGDSLCCNCTRSRLVCLSYTSHYTRESNHECFKYPATGMVFSPVLINLATAKAISGDGKHSVTRTGFSCCSVTFLPAVSHGNGPFLTHTWGLYKHEHRDTPIETKHKQTVTWVRWEESAALAVDDLLHGRHVRRDGRWDDPQTWHHGVDRRDSSHHSKSIIKI